ncbi:MAG: hypothetical protein QXU42_07465 [Thermoproteota archaeon]
MGGGSKEEEFRRDIAYILGTDYSPELLQEFEESLKSTFGYSFKWDSRTYGLIPEIEGKLDDLYKRGVRSALSFKDPLSELRKLWQHDDEISPIKGIYLNPNKGIEDPDTGVTHWGLVIIESPHALLRRFKGATLTIVEELKKSGIDWHELPGKINDEDFDEKAPITARFIKTGLNVAEEVKGITGINVCFSYGYSGLFFFRTYYSVPMPYFYVVFPYKDLSLEEVFKKIIEGAKAIKQSWAKWTEERREICEEMGMGDELFAARDILEVLLNLPSWTLDVKPTREGGEVVVDTCYVSEWLHSQNSKSIGNLGLKALEDHLVQIEFNKPQGVLSIFSPPVNLFPSVMRAIAKDADVEDLDKKSKRLYDKYYGLIKEILKRPLELRAIVPDYFIDRENLPFIEKASPSLARLLNEVINILEETEKEDKNIMKATLHRILLVDDIHGLCKIEPEVCDSDDEFTLRICMECSIRLDFRILNTSETIKHIPIWLERCLNTYRKLKSVSKEK